MSARFPACVSDGCRCGRDPCPTPIECGLAPPDVPRPTQPGELGEDENGAMERLERSTHETYCPFKGTASYYSFKDGAKNAAWTYEQPYDEMLAIQEHLAFYPDKVDPIREKGKP